MKKIVLSFIWISFLLLDAMAQDQCKPLGWATRDGRTGGVVEVTGGGSAEPITVTNFADLVKYATDGSPRVIYIDGDVGGGWSGRAGDRLSIKSNKTIVGIRPGTMLKAPIQIKDARNVIVRNLVIQGPGSSSDQAWDNIVIEGSSKNIWIDHCEFWDGQDGNSDAVKGADNITYTWNIFGYSKAGPHNFSNLIASSDNEPVSVGKLNITFMHNWFKGIDQRGPRCRYGNVHVVNNLYTKEGLRSSYSISAGFDCQVITENNTFIDTKTPIYTSHKGGSSAHYVTGNLFTNTSGNQTGYGSAFNVPYEYKSYMLPATQVEATVKANAGATLANPTACGGSVEPTEPTQPTLTLTSGTAEQSVQEGNEIQDIVYTWGGTATGVQVTGLPAGLTGQTNGSTYTITGTPTAEGEYTITTQQSTGTPVVLTGRIRLLPSVTYKLAAVDYCYADGESESSNAGFEESAYLNFDNSLGSAANYKIQATTATQTTMMVRYANGGTGSRPMSILVNNTNTGSMEFPITGDWTSWDIAQYAITLTSGNNDLQFKADVSEGGPNIDWIGFSDEGISANCNPVSQSLVAPAAAPSVQISGTILSIHGISTFHKSATPSTILIVDLLGKSLFEAQFTPASSDFTLDLKSLSLTDGIFFIKIFSNGSYVNYKLEVSKEAISMQ
jgi:pectate lyase